MRQPNVRECRHPYLLYEHGLHGSLASQNQEETVAFIGSSSIMKRKRIVIDDNTYTISDPSIMESLGGY